MKRILSISLACCLWILLSPAAQAILDSNNNGVSDLWEKHYNSGELFTNFGPQADPDGDGWTNEMEAAAGTNPLDPNPPDGMIRPETTHYPDTYSTDPDTQITTIDTPEAITLTWLTFPGKTYTLFYSTDLTETSWLPLGGPRAGTAWGMGIGIPLTKENNIRPDKVFWRVAVTESGLDSDADGLSDYEEYLAGTPPTITDSDGDTLSDYAELVAGTNPNNSDEDGDGLSDPFELAAGTSSTNQDSDGDAIPDSIDGDPLVSAQSFPDADGDGIPDSEDPEPNNSRGPPPSITSDNTSGNPLADVTKDEVSRFILTVSNPSGPAPGATDITFFLNGSDKTETVNITALSGPTGTQRFLLSWTAKVTTGYPAQTLQNISLRFKDNEEATTWLNLARIDVAEWEGLVAGIPDQRLQPFTEDSWVVQIASHLNGKKTFPSELAGSNRISAGKRYRGPLAMRLLGEDGLTVKGTATIPSDVRYPMMFIVRETVSLPSSASQIMDISSPEVIPARCIGYRNRSNYEVTMTLPSGSVSLMPNEMKFNALPDLEENPIMYRELGRVVGRSEYFYDKNAAAPYFSSSSRILDMGILENSEENDWPVLSTFRMSIGLERSITPHAAGSLEYPGSPLARSFLEDTSPLPIATEQWHKIVLKVGPDANAVSNGIGLWLRKGEYGDTAPQTGFTIMVGNPDGTQTNLTLPADGKINLAVGLQLHQRLISPQGLTLFIKRVESVTDIHDLSLQLLKKHEWQPEESVRIATMDILPFELSISHPEVVSILPPDYSADADVREVKITVAASPAADGTIIEWEIAEGDGSLSEAETTTTDGFASTILTTPTRSGHV